MTLTQLASPMNDPVSLFTICGGRISGVQALAWQDADAGLLQETKAMLEELRQGSSLAQRTQPFAIRLRPISRQESSGQPVIHAFELIKDERCGIFWVYPPLPKGDVGSRLQEASVYGGLFGASFNAEFQASLGEMSANEYARYSPPLEQKEGLKTARHILAHRPAVTTILPLHTKKPRLLAQAIQLAMHFTLAILE